MDARKTEIGYVPYAEDIDLNNLDYQISPGHNFTRDDLQSILNIEHKYWLEDIENIRQFYNKIGDTIPQKLRDELDAMEQRLLLGSKEKN